MKSLLLFCALLLLTRASQAALGESEAQCIARYGKPAGGGGENQLVFEQDGLQILVNFYQGQADYLAFSHHFTPVTRSKPLSHEQIARLLEENRGRESWSSKAAGDGHRVWTAHTRYAEVNADGELIVMAQKYPPRPARPTVRKDRSKDL